MHYIYYRYKNWPRELMPQGATGAWSTARAAHTGAVMEWSPPRTKGVTPRRRMSSTASCVRFKEVAWSVWTMSSNGRP